MSDGAARARSQAWRTPALAAASGLAHLVAFAVLALRAAGPPAAAVPPLPPVIMIEMEPRPLRPQEQPRTAVAPAAPGVAVRRAVALPAPPLPEEEEPRAAAPAAIAAPAVSDAWRVAPGGSPAAAWPGTAAGRLDCRRPERLSAEARARCDQAFGQAAAGAAPITGTGDPRRDARMARDAAQALANYEDRRRPLSGGVGVVGPADCVGSNFGTGCAGSHLNPSLQPDSARNVQTRRDGVRAAGAPLTPSAPGPLAPR